MQKNVLKMDITPIANVSIDRTKMKILRCDELKKQTIHPFSLTYLALGALLKNNLSVRDSENQVQKLKHLFETNMYKKLLQNMKYNVDENEYNLEIIDEVHVEYLKYWVNIENAFSIYKFLSIKKEERSFGGISTVRMWCSKCRLFYMRCTEDGYLCSELQRTENAHYSSCESCL